LIACLQCGHWLWKFATQILDRLSAVRALARNVYHLDTGSPVCRADIGCGGLPHRYWIACLQCGHWLWKFATQILDRLSAVQALARNVYHIDTGLPVCRAGIGCGRLPHKYLIACLPCGYWLEMFTT